MRHSLWHLDRNPFWLPLTAIFNLHLKANWHGAIIVKVHHQVLTVCLYSGNCCTPGMPFLAWLVLTVLVCCCSINPRLRQHSEQSSLWCNASAGIAPRYLGKHNCPKCCINPVLGHGKSWCTRTVSSAHRASIFSWTQPVGWGLEWATLEATDANISIQ